MGTPTGSQANRRVFMSRTLTGDVRLSGTATADLVASIACPTATPTCTTSQTNLSVVIADYSATAFPRSTAAARASRTRRPAPAGARPATTPSPAPSAPPAAHLGAECATYVREIDNACYLEVSKPITNVTSWRVTRGIRDTSNRDSLWFADATPVTIDTEGPREVPDDADRAHVQGRPSDRDHRRRLEHLDGVRHRQRQRAGHARRQAVEGHAADPGRVLRHRLRGRHRRRDRRAAVRRPSRRTSRPRPRTPTASPSPTRSRPRPTTRIRTRRWPARRPRARTSRSARPSSPARRPMPTATSRRERSTSRRRAASRSVAPSPATLALTLGAPAQFGRVHAGRDEDLHGLDHGHRDLDRG